MKSKHLAWVCVLAAGVLAAQEARIGQDRVPTYAADIQPIFSRKCVMCHVKGGVGPFPLDSHAEVSKRLELVRTVALSRIMPPYDIESDFGNLGVVPQLTDEEAVALQRWIQAKGPKGVPAQSTRLSPASAAGLGKVLVLESLGAPKVKPEGTPYWRGFLIPIPKEQTGFITSSQVMPKSANSLRNAVIYLAPTSVVAKLKNGREVTGGEVPGRYLIGVSAPGSAPFMLPKGLGFRIQPGSYLYVRTHYAPSGRPADGGFTVKLTVSRDRNTVQPEWWSLGRRDFVIPANKTPTWTFNKRVDAPTRIIAILPEARFYASGMRLLLSGDSGKTQRLFETRRWNPYWVANYQFEVGHQPVAGAGSVLTAEISYANDPKCSMNEGKTPKPINSGPGLGDELCWMHVLAAPAEP